MSKQEKIMFGNSAKSVRKFLVDRKLPKNKQEFAIMDYLLPKPIGYTGI